MQRGNSASFDGAVCKGSERAHLDRTATAPLPDLRPPIEKGNLRRASSGMKKPFRLDRTSVTAIEMELNAAMQHLDDGYQLQPQGDGEQQGAGAPEAGTRSRSRRRRLVRFLHSGPVHTAATVLLILDLILVVVSLELQIQVRRLEGLAYKDCLAEYEKGHAMPLPLVNDTTCNPEGLHVCDPHHSDNYEKAHLLHEVEIGLAVVSCIILTLFLIENILMIVALRWRFFTHFFFVLDIVVVSVSLSLELWAIATVALDDFEMALGIIIVGRMWRFFRVAHGLYFLEHAEEEGHELGHEAGRNSNDDEGSKSAPGVVEGPLRLSRLAEEAEGGPKESISHAAMKNKSSNAV